MPKRKAEKSRKGKSSKGRILFVSYFFPPTAGGGVFRALATVKYLSRLGWDITVLCATHPKSYPQDAELGQSIPGDVEIIRVPIQWENSLLRRTLGKTNLDFIPKHLLMPDERIFWAERAASVGRKLLKEEDYDLIYTTAPPYSILLTGLWLKRELDYPWLCEYRDPWTFASYVPFVNPRHKSFAHTTETEIAEKADAIVMVTETYKNRMEKLYPFARGKIFCVPNAYDTDDFRKLKRNSEKNERFTILVSGTVFGKKRNNLDDFIDALIKIKSTEPELLNKITVFFQGLPSPQVNLKLLDAGLDKICQSRGFVSHRENLESMMNADLLLLTMAPAPNDEIHIPQRTYEMVASGKPILAVCPESELSRLLSEFPQATILRLGDIDGIIESIKVKVSEWESGVQIPEFDSTPAIHTRENRVKEIDSILTNLLNTTREGRG